MICKGRVSAKFGIIQYSHACSAGGSSMSVPGCTEITLQGELAGIRGCAERCFFVSKEGSDDY